MVTSLTVLKDVLNLQTSAKWGMFEGMYASQEKLLWKWMISTHLLIKNKMPIFHCLKNASFFFALFLMMR